MYQMYKHFTLVCKFVSGLIPLMAFVWSSFVTLPTSSQASGFTWSPVNGSADGNWTHSEHWAAEPGRYPGSEGLEDTALIDISGESAFTVTLNTNPILESFTLNSSQAVFSASGRTFSVGGSGLLQAGRVEWTNSIWNGGDGLSGMSLVIGPDVNLLVRQLGRFDVLDFEQTGIVTMEGSGSTLHSVLSVPHGITNRGTLILTSNGTLGRADIQVDEGAILLNESEGLIELRSPTSSRNRDFLADLDNHGTISVLDNAIARFNRENGIFTNRGTLSTGTAGGAEVFPGRTFVQADGSLANAGTFTVNQGIFQHTGGSITGNPIEMNSASLAIGPYAGEGGFLFRNANNTITGNPIAGYAITLEGSGSTAHAILQANDGFTNFGSIKLASNGTVGRAELRVAAGTLVNEGTIEFLSPASSRDRDLTGNVENLGTVAVLDNAIARFGEDGDVFTNLNTLRTGPQGSFTLAAGRTLVQAGGSLENEGTVEVNQGSFQHTGGTISGNPVELNSASLAIGPGAGSGEFLLRGLNNTMTGNPNAGHEIVLQGSGASAHAILQAPDGFTNAGRIVLTSIGTVGRAELRVTDGTLVNEGTVEFLSPLSSRDRDLAGNFKNLGTVAVLDNAVARFGEDGDVFTNLGTLRTGPQGVLTLAAGRTLVQAGGTLENEGSVVVTQGSFHHTGGAITGNPVRLTNAALHIGPEAGAGAIVMEENTEFTGNSTEAHHLTVRGLASATHARLISAEGFINRGTLDFTSTGTAGRADLEVTGGILENEGVIRLLSPFSSRIRNLVGNIENSGTFTVLDNAVGNYGSPENEFTNHGLFHTGPMGEFSMGTGSTFSQQNGNLFTEGVFTITNGHFEHTGGVVTGKPVLLIDSSIHLNPEAGNGLYVVQGNAEFTGEIGPSQVLTVRGVFSSGHALLTSQGDLTNRGVLELTSTGTAGLADMTVTDGTFFNQGTLNLRSPFSSRIRAILADMENSGNIHVLDNAVARFNREGGFYTNAGTLRLAPLASAELPAGRTFTQTSGGGMVIDFNTSGGFGRITGTGTVALDGTITPRTPAQYAPPVNATYVVVTAGMLDGEFTNLAPIGGLPGRWWQVEYGDTTVTLRVVAGAVSLEDWLAERFTAAEQADPEIGGPLGDPAGAGVPNVLSYLLGLDPRVPDRSLLPQAQIFTVQIGEEPATRHAGLVYDRRVETDGINVSYEISTDLASWTPAVVTEEILNTESVMETVRVFVDEPLAEEARVFLRLVISTTAE